MRVNLISLETELELVSIDYIQRLCRLVKNYPVSRTRHEIEGWAVNVIFISPSPRPLGVYAYCGVLAS